MIIKNIISILCFLSFARLSASFAQESKWLELNSKVYELMGKLKYDDAIKVCKESIKVCENTFGAEHQNTLTTLTTLASLYFGSQKYPEAESVYKKLININEKLYGKNSINITSPLTLLSSLYQTQGKYLEAESIYKRILEVYKNLYGEDDPQMATPMINLAGLYQTQSKINEAEYYYKKVISIYEKVYGSENQITLSIISTLASLYQMHGRYADAEELFKKKENILKRAIDSIENTENMNSQAQLNLVNDLAALFQGQGKHSEAEKLFKRSIEIGEKIYGKDNVMVTSSLTGLLTSYQMAGMYFKAEELYKKIIEINEKSYGKYNQFNSGLLLGFGGLYVQQKKYSDAESIYLKAMEIYEKLYGKESQMVSASLMSLASVYHFQNKYLEAEKIYRRSFEINEKLFGKDNQMSVGVLLLLAHLNALQNSYTLADSLYKKTVQIYEKFYGKDNIYMAGYLYSIATMYYLMDRYPEAESYEQRALKIFESTFGYDMSKVNTAYLYIIANCYYNQNDFNKANLVFDKLMKYLADQFDKVFLFLSEKEKMSFLERTAYNFPSYYSFAFNNSKANPQINKNLYNLILWQKGIVLSSTISMIGNILKSNDKESIDILDNLKTSREKLAKFYSGSQKDIEKNKKEIDYLEKKANDLEEELTLKSKSYAAEKKLKNIKWEDIQNKLKPDEAAIEFLAFKYNYKKFTDTTIYIALIITKETKEYPAMVTMGTEKDLKNIINFYRLSVNQDPLQKTLEKGNKPYSFIWKPMENHLKIIKRIYISPDGLLNQISFGTLVDDDGKFLNEKFELRYVSNTKDIFREYDIKSLNKYSVLIGNPNFSADTGVIERKRGNLINDRNMQKRSDPNRGLRSFDFKSNPLTDLPGTKTEIENISGMLKRKNWNVNIYTEDEAIEEVVKNVKSPRILHIATHGFFLPEQDIDLNKQQVFSQVEDSKIFLAQENPMLRSGLFFSGANNLIKNEEVDDGILTAYEAANIDLQGTEFVILSACETGLGDIKSGEGVFGLRRSFQSAGAESIIMSLWSVPDKETQEMMSLFYGKWLNGMDKYSAFHNAQNEMKKIVKERYGKDIPFYWGSFVMVGR
jgi:CHAT domain-containing protein